MVKKTKVTNGLVTLAAKVPAETFDKALAVAFNRERARTNAEVVQAAIRYYAENAPLIKDK